MVYRWIDIGLLQFVGLELHKEMFNLSSAHHFEIFRDPVARKSLHVACLADQLSEENYHFNYYFGTFEGKSISPGIETQEELDELRDKLIAIKKPANKIRARDLNNKLLGVLFKEGYGKLIRTYYINY